jgi:hypothetical protein
MLDFRNAYLQTTSTTLRQPVSGTQYTECIRLYMERLDTGFTPSYGQQEQLTYYRRCQTIVTTFLQDP